MKKPVAGMVAYPPTKKTPKPKSTGPSVISKIKGALGDKPKYTLGQIVAQKKMQAEIDAAKKNKSKTTTKKPAIKRPNAKPVPLPAKPKPKPKPRIVQMPSKISPSKMTPAQKAKYLQNPERYDG